MDKVSFQVDNKVSIQVKVVFNIGTVISTTLKGPYDVGHADEIRDTMFSFLMHGEGFVKVFGDVINMREVSGISSAAERPPPDVWEKIKDYIK